MRRFWIVILTFIGGFAAASVAQGPMEYMQPAEENAWLQKFVGEWESKSEMRHSPDAEPIAATGTKSTRAVGTFWIVAEGKADVMGTTVESVMTLGYDVVKEKYVGTWIDSMTGICGITRGRLTNRATS